MSYQEANQAAMKGENTGQAVYVVMGNDYPCCVWETHERAQAFCDHWSAKQEKSATHVYWRVYEFKVLK